MEIYFVPDYLGCGRHVNTLKSKKRKKYKSKILFFAHRLVTNVAVVVVKGEGVKSLRAGMF